MAKVNKTSKKAAKVTEATPVVTAGVPRQSVVKGLVVAAKTAQTAIVLVERRKMHPLYKKTVKRSKRYLVHDLVGVKEGDLVEIMQCKPVSKNKRWMIYKVVGRDIELMETQELKSGVDEAIAEVMPEAKVEEEVVETAEASVETEIEAKEEEKVTKKVKKEKK
jgi:small subunit ribosomal protein S17